MLNENGRDITGSIAQNLVLWRFILAKGFFLAHKESCKNSSSLKFEEINMANSSNVVALYASTPVDAFFVSNAAMRTNPDAHFSFCLRRSLLPALSYKWRAPNQ